MKKFLFAVTTLVVLGSTSLAQEVPGVGINMPSPPDPDTLIKAALDVRGNARITNVPLSLSPTYVVVLNSYDSILSKYSIEDFALLMSGVSSKYQDIVGWGYGTFGGSNMTYTKSFFKDKSDKLSIPFDGGTGYFAFQTNILPVQERNAVLDWGTMSSFANFFIRGGAVSLNDYLYIAMEDQGTSERRIYRYNRANLGAGGIQMTFTGLSLVNNTEFIMASNGKDFFFNYNAGNSGSDNVIAKYQLSGTTFNYISSTTIGSPGDFEQSFLVDSAGNYYALSKVGITKLKKFSPSGSLLREHISYAKALMNWSDELYSLQDTYYERFNK